MIEVKDLTLKVERQIPGELVTNALAIKAFVEDRIKDFSVEKYAGDAEAAKKDRAVLNNAIKELDGKRLQLEREFMAPFEEFKKIIKDTTSLIKEASIKLDNFVKQKEAEEKEAKKEKIRTLFDSKHFGIVDFDEFIDQRWLNKSYKMKDIEEEMDAKIKKITSDFDVINGLGQDQMVARVKYLETFDLSQAFAAAETAKQARERLAQEEKDRIARQIEQQKKEVVQDAEVWKREESVSSLAAEAAGVEDDPIIEYTLKFRGTRSALLSMRKYMTELGITYEKI